MSNQRYSLPIQPDFEPDLSFPLSALHPAEDQAPMALRLLYLSACRYERDWSCSLHSHGFSEIFYITGGKGYFLIKGKKCPVEKGCLVIINPQVEHGEFSSDASPLEYTVLGIEGLQFTPSASQQEEAPVIRITHSAQAFAACVNALQEELRTPLQGQAAICQNLLNILLVLIQRQKEIHISITPFHDVNPECMAIKDYIDSHFKDPLTLEQLAQVAHQNKYYLSHSFKDAFGTSPMRYLMERRIEESKYLLDETDSSIGQISSNVGFSSSSHYSQAFRRYTNMSPNEYRSMSRKQEH